MKLATFAAALMVSISPAFAGDWYVDAASGSDANDGLTPATAWKTLSHALGAVPTPPTGAAHLVHIETGVYDAALGETFPLAMRPGLQLIGDSIAWPVLDGGGQNVDLVRIDAGPSGVQADFDSLTLVQRLVLRRGARGVFVRAEAGRKALPRVRDVEVREMGVAGVEVVAEQALAFPLLDGLVVELNPVGVRAAVGDLAADSGYALWNSSVRHNTGRGIECIVTGGALGASSRIDVSGSLIHDNGADGVAFEAVHRGSFIGFVRDGLVARNGGGGIVASDLSLFGAPCLAAITQTTIADNGGVGVEFAGLAGGSVAESVLWGNTGDLAAGASVAVSFSDVGDGSASGNGNFAADPQFVDPALVDYALLPGSPCIDTGDPTSPQDADCSPNDVGAYWFEQVNPAAYCTAKVNSCGSLPSIGSTGSPSASATSGFVVSASQAKAGKTGLLLYSVQGRAATPFQGGFLCLAGTIKRSPPLVDTTGTGTNCDGVLGLDMNGFAHGLLGGTPLPALTVAGTRVDCQIWGRDTVGNVLLSDGLEYFVCP